MLLYINYICRTSSPPAVASDRNGDGGAKIFMSAKFHWVTEVVVVT